MIKYQIIKKENKNEEIQQKSNKRTIKSPKK